MRMQPRRPPPARSSPQQAHAWSRTRAVGHMGRRHPRRILRPGLRQIQCAVDEGVVMPRDEGREHADLAVRDLARRPRVSTERSLDASTTDTTGCLALLRKAGLIDSQHRVPVGQALHHIVPHDIAQRIGVPSGATENSLLTPWTRIAGRLRLHPPRLATFVPKQPIEKQANRRRHTILAEKRPDPSLLLPQQQCPKLKRRLDRNIRHP